MQPTLLQFHRNVVPIPPEKSLLTSLISQKKQQLTTETSLHSNIKALHHKNDTKKILTPSRKLIHNTNLTQIESIKEASHVYYKQGRLWRDHPIQTEDFPSISNLQETILQLKEELLTTVRILKINQQVDVEKEKLEIYLGLLSVFEEIKKDQKKELHKVRFKCGQLLDKALMQFGGRLIDENEQYAKDRRAELSKSECGLDSQDIYEIELKEVTKLRYQTSRYHVILKKNGLLDDQKEWTETDEKAKIASIIEDYQSKSSTLDESIRCLRVKMSSLEDQFQSRLQKMPSVIQDLKTLNPNIIAKENENVSLQTRGKSSLIDFQVFLTIMKKAVDNYTAKMILLGFSSVGDISSTSTPSYSTQTTKNPSLSLNTNINDIQKAKLKSLGTSAAELTSTNSLRSHKSIFFDVKKPPKMISDSDDDNFLSGGRILDYKNTRRFSLFSQVRSVSANIAQNGKLSLDYKEDLINKTLEKIEKLHREQSLIVKELTKEKKATKALVKLKVESFKSTFVQNSSRISKLIQKQSNVLNLVFKLGSKYIEPKVDIGIQCELKGKSELKKYENAERLVIVVPEFSFQSSTETLTEAELEKLTTKKQFDYQKRNGLTLASTDPIARPTSSENHPIYEQSFMSTVHVATAVVSFKRSHVKLASKRYAEQHQKNIQTSIDSTVGLAVTGTPSSRPSSSYTLNDTQCAKSPHSLRPSSTKSSPKKNSSQPENLASNHQSLTSLPFPGAREHSMTIGDLHIGDQIAMILSGKRVEINSNRETSLTVKSDQPVGFPPILSKKHALAGSTAGLFSNHRQPEMRKDSEVKSNESLRRNLSREVLTDNINSRSSEKNNKDNSNGAVHSSKNLGPQKTSSTSVQRFSKCTSHRTLGQEKLSTNSMQDSIKSEKLDLPNITTAIHDFGNDLNEKEQLIIETNDASVKEQYMAPVLFNFTMSSKNENEPTDIFTGYTMSESRSIEPDIYKEDDAPDDDDYYDDGEEVAELAPYLGIVEYTRSREVSIDFEYSNQFVRPQMKNSSGFEEDNDEEESKNISNL